VSLLSLLLQRGIELLLPELITSSYEVDELEPVEDHEGFPRFVDLGPPQLFGRLHARLYTGCSSAAGVESHE
jgi:hypothetical protein